MGKYVPPFRDIHPFFIHGKACAGPGSVESWKALYPLVDDLVYMGAAEIEQTGSTDVA